MVIFLSSQTFYEQSILRNYLILSTESEMNSLQAQLYQRQYFERLYGSKTPAKNFTPESDFGRIYKDITSVEIESPDHPEIKKFLRRREEWQREKKTDNGQNTKEQCENCAINSNCFDYATNPWHPMKVSVRKKVIVGELGRLLIRQLGL